MTRIDHAIGNVVTQLLAEPDIGTVHIVDITANLASGADGQQVVRLVVILRDPDADEETWPIDDVRRLRIRIYDLLAGSDEELPEAVVDIQPETPDDADTA